MLAIFLTLNHISVSSIVETNVILFTMIETLHVLLEEEKQISISETGNSMNTSVPTW